MDSKSPRQPQTSQPNIFDVIEDAYSSGASDIEICRILKVRPAAFEQRYQRDPIFRELIDMGRMLRKAWWMEQSRINMNNPRFNHNAWLNYMKNEFGWTEKVHTVTDNKEKTFEELQQEVGPVVRAMMEKFLLGGGEENGTPN